MMDKPALDRKLHGFFHDVIRQSFRQLGIYDSTVTRYMADHEFQGSAFPILAREIFETIRSTVADATKGETGRAPRGS